MGQMGEGIGRIDLGKAKEKERGGMRERERKL
jgi:hypothetical protein